MASARRPCPKPPRCLLVHGERGCLLRDGMLHLHRETQGLPSAPASRGQRGSQHPAPPREALHSTSGTDFKRKCFWKASDAPKSQRGPSPCAHPFCDPAFVRNSSSWGSNISGLQGRSNAQRARTAFCGIEALHRKLSARLDSLARPPVPSSSHERSAHKQSRILKGSCPRFPEDSKAQSLPSTGVLRASLSSVDCPASKL